jgi:hypothetical protein
MVLALGVLVHNIFNNMDLVLRFSAHISCRSDFALAVLPHIYLSDLALGISLDGYEIIRSCILYSGFMVPV